MSEQNQDKVSIDDIIEQEAFGWKASENMEEMRVLREGDPVAAIEAFNQRMKLIDENNDVRPAWMCWRDKTCTPTERAMVLQHLLGSVATLGMTEKNGVHRFYTTYCFEGEIADESWRIMASNQTMQDHLLCYYHLHWSETNEAPDLIYSGIPPMIMHVMTRENFIIKLIHTLIGYRVQ